MRAHRSILKFCITLKRNIRRKDAAILDLAGETQVQNTHRHAVADKNRLNVIRGTEPIVFLDNGIAHLRHTG